MSQHKVIIAAVPYVNTARPLAAPAVLKASLSKHGIDAVALDLNADVENYLQKHKHKQEFVWFFKNQIISEPIVDELVSMIDHCAEEILMHKPTIIGLSLFCYSCQHFTAWLCAALRQKSPDTKIIIGGPGLQLLSGMIDFSFPAKLKKKGLIDDYISGDGEISLVEYVKGNLNYPGINSSQWQPVDDLNSLPMPDYSDYRWHRYAEKSVPIIDSRGCVQNCEFCDVIVYWKKFQWLNADNIFNQMMSQMEKYGYTKFEFRSSVCNGNLKEFKKLLKLLSDYNLNQNLYPTERISWDGSFIIRSALVHNEEFWKLLKDSNPERLFVGVESVVERVRVQLGKKFSNQDLDHFLEMTQKYQIPVNLLCISGYPSETDEEYEASKQWFRDRSKYANNSVAGVQLSSSSVLPGTQLEKNIHNYKMIGQKISGKEKHEELEKIIKESGFRLLDYNLMDRPD